MEKKERTSLYEGMYILSASLSEEARQKALDRIVAGITKRGGELCKVFDLGRKKLAYEINRKRDGHYVLLYFKVATKAITEMWREYHLNEDLIRFLTLTTEAIPEKIEFKPFPEQ